MVDNIQPGDQAAELEQHPGQSRSGDRHHGCRGMGRGGRDRYAVHLRWLPRRSGPGASANRGDLVEPSSGCLSCSERSPIRRGEVVPGRQSARDPRPVPGPTVAVVVLVYAATLAVIKLAEAAQIGLAQAAAIGVALARVIPVRNTLMRTGLTWAAS